MILQLTIQRVIMQILGAISGAPANPSAPGGDWMGAVGRMNPTSAYAMGGTFAANNIVPYAMGGAFTNSVVSKPTLFKFAAGGTMRTGLMGEAGPEAIMPLSRGPNGKLGVASSGGGGTNVTVNVDASGNSQVAGDQNQGAQLGRVIAGAVQQELIRQKRPGGLLA
jgi:lambda family phage tail tape measure protein